MNDIVLTGPKCSGKTSAGKMAASLSSFEFIDLDELIFQRTGKTPRRLYTESRVIFQKAEADALAAVFADFRGQRRIIAAGGGIIDNPEAAAKLKNSNSTIVYLNICADCAWNRIISKGGQALPLSNGNLHSILPPFLQTENPQETHRALHERRAAAFLQLADIVIEAEEKKPEEVAAEILEHINVRTGDTAG